MTDFATLRHKHRGSGSGVWTESSNSLQPMIRGQCLCHSKACVGICLLSMARRFEDSMNTQTAKVKACDICRSSATGGPPLCWNRMRRWVAPQLVNDRGTFHITSGTLL